MKNTIKDKTVLGRDNIIFIVFLILSLPIITGLLLVWFEIK